ncbi:MAG: DUF4381 family protein [Steroidobacteraceae bacterium]|jgi:hypothetical protein
MSRQALDGRGAVAAAVLAILPAARAVAAAVLAVLFAAASALADEDIRDIRGPKFIWPWWLTPALLAAALLLALLGVGIWRWLRRRRRPRALLPFEVALQRLEAIRPLMQPPSAREFSTAVSDIVREYIERRFDVIATHRTTEEFLRDLLESSQASLLRHRALLSEFLHQCDLVKFAGISLTPQNMESLYHSARAFVLETAKPDPEPDALGAPQVGGAPAGAPQPPPQPGALQPQPSKSAKSLAPAPAASRSGGGA